jgi:long-chain fatty acid transport protein
MTKTIKLALVAALALGATSAFATNGSALIGTGAKARGMGGAGIGVSHGAESALVNPALITSIEKDHEVQFGGTIFMPSVSANMGAGASNSVADMNVIPSVSIANKINDNFYWGIGMWGTAGMGVDYRKETGMTSNFQMVTNLQLMQFGVPLSYTTNNFSIGITPVLQYGALDINYKGTLDTATAAAQQLAKDPKTNVAGGAGVAQDLKFGFNVGLAYEIEDVTIGASYKSKIAMEYDGQLSGASATFAKFGMFGGQPLGDKLATPAEMGLGISYKIAGSTIAIDYKMIQWSDAEGYKEFKWKDQSVIALGYEYATSEWVARVGFNHASSPIVSQADGAGTADTTGSAINMFNSLGFPGIVESHFTLGGTYNFSEMTSMDLALAYAPEVTEKYSIKGFSNFGPTNPQSVEVKHSQTSVTLGLNYAF